MKFTLESLDFTSLTKDSVLMVEISHESPDNFQRVQRIMQSLYDSGKIPKGALCIVNTKTSPFKIRELPEKLMNENGWIKLKFQNAVPLSAEGEAMQTGSNSHPALPEKKV